MERSPKIKGASIDAILSEYSADDSVFMDCPPIIKIVGLLPEQDRRLIILYVELGSERKLATMLGISPGWAHKKLAKIKREILKIYQNVH